MRTILGVLLIWVLAFALRGALLANSWRGQGAWNLETDSGLYIRLADALVHGRGFEMVAADGQFHPEYLTLPPYPLFLALFKLLGRHWQLAALLAQCALGAGVAAAVYAVSRRMVGPRAALLGGLLASVDIQSVLYANLILTDVLGMAATFAALVLLQRYCARPTWRGAAVCGLALALAAFIRPVGVYLWLIGAAVVLVNRGARLRHKLVHVGSMALLAGVPVVGWSARNYVRAGSWFYSTTPDIVLVNWQLARLVMETDGVSQPEARRIIASRLGIADTWQSLSRNPDPHVRVRAHALALELVRQHPGLFARLYLTGMLRVAAQPDHNVSLVFGQQPTETGLAKGQTSLLRALQERWDELSPTLRILYFGQLPFVLALWLLAALGAGVGLVNPATRPLAIGLTLTAACVLLTAGGHPGDPRYRLPALPALDVLAALGLQVFMRRGSPAGLPASESLRNRR